MSNDETTAILCHCCVHDKAVALITGGGVVYLKLKIHMGEFFRIQLK